jgi:hypothetical protein
MLSALRWVLLASAILNLAASTVLWRPVFRPLNVRWWGWIRARGAAIPPILADEWMQRAWGVVSAIIFLAWWWYLGTSAGAATFQRLVRMAAP